MATTPRTVRGRLSAVEQELSAQRESLLARFAQQRAEVCTEREPDDECGEANRNLARHLAISALDRERRTLSEIEVALKRLKSGEYGVCDSCGSNIPEPRLRALPWTRFCIHCAEKPVVS